MNIRVGADVDSLCTRCKLVLAHTIEAVVGNEIARVSCNTCGSKHQHRNPKKATASSVKKEKNSSMSLKSKVSDFDRLMRERSNMFPQSYNASLSFSENDVLNHSTFGLGVVVAQRGANKIEVLFEQGPKVLVQGL